MCSRFTLTHSLAELSSWFEVEIDAGTPAMPPRYNIAPTQPVIVIRQLTRHEPRRLAPVIWGLIPPWSKDPAAASMHFNARQETVAEKPSFKNAYKNRRCVIPVSGWYEWKHHGPERQPQYVHAGDGQPLALAGLWEIWSGPDGSEFETCTILTRDAIGDLAAIHARQPVVLKPSVCEAWVDPDRWDAKVIQAMLHQGIQRDGLTSYRVSPRVNSETYDGPGCLTPLEDTPERPLTRGEARREALTAAEPEPLMFDFS